MLWWILGAVGFLVFLYVAWSVYLGLVLRWEDEHSVGLAYYGLPPAERARFKRRLRFHAILLQPLLWLNARLVRMDFRRVGFDYKGVGAPAGSCSPETFARAEGYRPGPEDVFVVTQMKCGTTWMQHVVYQVLCRGAGDLVDSGRTLYALCPWIEGRKSVPLEQAPLIGTERPSRVIKTHLPARLCPYSAEARYIYVARHPVSCFASCIDFVVTNVGAMAPALPQFEEWFRSPDLMWWGTWTEHVTGWWERSRTASNVLFVYFEDMKRDLAAVVRRVAAFLGLVPLSEAEVARIVEQCGFRYMQEHQDSFEMHPPHILQTNADLFVSGRADRHKDVPPETRQRILAWAAEGLAGKGMEVEKVWPDVGGEKGR